MRIKLGEDDDDFSDNEDDDRKDDAAAAKGGMMSPSWVHDIDSDRPWHFVRYEKTRCVITVGSDGVDDDDV
eukprot:gene9638-18671_t